MIVCVLKALPKIDEMETSCSDECSSCSPWLQKQLGQEKPLLCSRCSCEDPQTHGWMQTMFGVSWSDITGTISR